jgi:hypothetical protein
MSCNIIEGCHLRKHVFRILCVMQTYQSHNPSSCKIYTEESKTLRGRVELKFLCK